MNDIVRIEQLAWTDYHRRVLERNPVVILPVGSLEQHGPHLPMNCDSAICVDSTILIGRPSAAIAMDVAEGAPKARSIACEGIARVGPLTSANLTHSMSRPSFSANFICSMTAPKPSEKPLVQ